MTLPTDDVGTMFPWYADHVFGQYSPLYARLSKALALAEAPVVQRLAAAVAAGQPLPNLVFGAVHDRLLAGTDHPLRDFYPSVTGGPIPDGDPVPSFIDFCNQYEDALLPILQNRRVQTNEVRRSALWLPAMVVAAATHGDQRLSLVECGTSAGLNLLWDRYGYAYGGDDRHFGQVESPVQLHSSFRGEHRPTLPERLPQIVGRLGIDLHPLDVHDPEQVRWLRALLWPEQTERAALLMAAVGVAQREEITFQAGDLLALLPEAVRQVDASAVPLIMHSFTFNQLTAEQRDEADTIVAELGAERDLSRLAIEWLTGDGPTITHTAYRHGLASTTVLAKVDQHGNWLEWLV